MSELLAIGLKRAAIALADELDYSKAAEKLNVSPAELKKQISSLKVNYACIYFGQDKSGSNSRRKESI